MDLKILVVRAVLDVASPLVHQVLAAPRERLVADAQVRVLRRGLVVVVRRHHELDEDAGDRDGEEEGVLLPVLHMLVVRGVLIREGTAADRLGQRRGPDARDTHRVEQGGHRYVAESGALSVYSSSSFLLVEPRCSTLSGCKDAIGFAGVCTSSKAKAAYTKKTEDVGY